jgi:hypothetical protein
MTMKDQITKITVEAGRMRISDFAVEFVEDAKAFEEGWVHCYVEILDEDGDVVRGFEAKSGVHFCGGGSLFGSVHNQGLNDVVEEAMEQYLDHPGVKAKLIAVYEEGLRLAAADGEENEDDEDSGIDAAVQFLKTHGAKIVHADSEEVGFHSYGDSKTLFQTPMVGSSPGRRRAVSTGRASARTPFRGRPACAGRPAAIRFSCRSLVSRRTSRPSRR